MRILSGPAVLPRVAGRRKVQPAEKATFRRGDPGATAPSAPVRPVQIVDLTPAAMAAGAELRWIAHERRIAAVTIDPRAAVEAYLRAGRRPQRRRDLVPPL